jgi:hypothetical protein
MAPFLAAVAVAAFAALLMWINYVRDTRRVLVKLFAARETPDGALVDCELRFPLYEVSIFCRAHAGETGLYMERAPDAPDVGTKGAGTRRGRFSHRGDLDRPVFIPWWRLEHRRARFPMRGWVRFDIVNTKSSFFLRDAKALELLRAAGRTL